VEKNRTYLAALLHPAFCCFQSARVMDILKD
jgi:hypothetical protein